MPSGKKPNRTRSHPICIRLSEDEFTAINEKRLQTGLNMTDYLVRTLSEKPLLVCSQKTELAQLTAQLQAIGNNLNQVARQLNSGYASGLSPQIQKITDDHENICNQLLICLENIVFPTIPQNTTERK